MKKHPEWFSDTAIPENLSGEPFRDAAGRWSGACISSSGIVFNRDVLRRLGIERDPQSWQDLADPRYFGQLALTDPAKSGSVAKVFEMLIQQQMHLAVAEAQTKQPGRRTAQEIEAEAVETGWMNGMRLIQRIAANARYFSDTSTKIPLEVLRGEAAAGMCIDFYGRSAEEDVRKADGSSRVGFVAPLGGTSVSVDPIAMFRGAPNADVATAFMEFVLSDAGQKLWCYRIGEPGGPQQHALRRLPVRRDFYTAENLPLMNDSQEMPFEKAKAFTYAHSAQDPPSIPSASWSACSAWTHTRSYVPWHEIIASGMSSARSPC